MIFYEVGLTNTTGVYPDTVADNVSAPGAGDGTEFVKILVDDIWGRAQALMNYAGLAPDGVSEADGTAQILTALSNGYAIGPGIGVTYWKNGTPVANNDRVLLLQGQVILIATYAALVAATYVGDGNNGTAPAFYKTSDAGGTIRNIAGPYFVLPDSRGLSLKNIGNATVNGRTKTGPVELGEMQEDQLQGHFHKMIRDTQTGSDGICFSVNGNSSTTETDDLVLNTVSVKEALTDGTNGTPRTGLNTRDSVLGTNFGITY